METEIETSRYPEPKSAVWITIGSIFAVFFTTIALTLLIFQLQFGNNIPQELSLSSTLSKVMLIIGEILLMIIPLIYVIGNKYNPKTIFRFNGISFKTFFSVVLISLSVSIITDELDRIITNLIPLPEFLKKWQIEFLEETERVMKADSLFTFILIITGAVICAPVIEEMIFRGFLQGSFEKTGQITNAVIVSSSLFAITHFNIFWFIQILAFGIILGFIAYKSNSIYPSIIAHSLNNFLAVIFINLGEEKLNWYLWGEHVSPFVLISALLIGFVGFRMFYSDNRYSNEKIV